MIINALLKDFDGGKSEEEYYTLNDILDKEIRRRSSDEPQVLRKTMQVTKEERSAIWKDSSQDRDEIIRKIMIDYRTLREKLNALFNAEKVRRDSLIDSSETQKTAQNRIDIVLNALFDKEAAKRDSLVDSSNSQVQIAMLNAFTESINRGAKDLKLQLDSSSNNEAQIQALGYLKSNITFDAWSVRDRIRYAERKRKLEYFK